MTEENLKLWEKNLFNAIKDLSDIDSQRKTWTGTHPQYISSFSETISVLYDDFDFEEYIKYYKSLNGEDLLYLLLTELNKMINSYKPTSKDELILNDPKWVEITDKAKMIDQIGSNYSK